MERNSYRLQKVFPERNHTKIRPFQKRSKPRFTSNKTLGFSTQHLLSVLLQKIKVCHFDIKAQNIVYDVEKSLPIMIDFGL